MSAIVDVSFSSMRPYSQPFAMRLVQKEYKHDVALLSIYNDNSDAKRYVSGSPVMVTYGFVPTLRVFYGYVNHVDQQSVPGGKTREERASSVATCVGASFPLKDAANKAWISHTSPQVARDIASQFRLNPSIEDHSFVWPSLKQAGRSYWAFLVYLAQRIGFVVYCTGIQLHFHERDTNPTSLTGAVPLYDGRDAARVKQFRISMGSESPLGGRLAARQYDAMDPLSGNLYTLTDSGVPSGKTLGATTVIPLFTEIQHDLQGSSLAQSQAVLDGKVAYNKLFVQASAVITGDARITQGMLIYLKNTPNSQDGLWYVLEADHRLEHGRYLTYLTLGRESIDSTQTYAFSSTFAPQPTARLVNGLWVAA